MRRSGFSPTAGPAPRTAPSSSPTSLKRVTFSQLSLGTILPLHLDSCPVSRPASVFTLTSKGAGWTYKRPPSRSVAAHRNFSDSDLKSRRLTEHQIYLQHLERLKS